MRSDQTANESSCPIASCDSVCSDRAMVSTSGLSGYVSVLGFCDVDSAQAITVLLVADGIVGLKLNFVAMLEPSESFESGEAQTVAAVLVLSDSICSDFCYATHHCCVEVFVTLSVTES